MQNPEEIQIWKKLFEEKEKTPQLKEIFKTDINRFEKYSFCYSDKKTEEKILFDFSKNMITDETLKLLLELALCKNIENIKKDMFSGKKINFTENRAVLHYALRNISFNGEKIVPLSEIFVDGKNIMPAIVLEFEKMKSLVEKIRSGSWRGYSGKRIQNIVNIGIGGSDLGPRMICKALSVTHDERITPYFVSNVDPNDLSLVLKSLNAEKTLFIIVSKTFTTAETLENAHVAKKWICSNMCESAVEKHFVAVSTNLEKVSEFGINTENTLGFWDWVGGRFSLWSTVGLSIALTYGFSSFLEILSGAHSVDMHFKETPLEKNIPVLMALIGVLYNEIYKAETSAILPYEHTLSLLPSYLQQLVMESCGKQTTSSGLKTEHQTGSIVWGGECTNAQHAFFQLLHQGTKLIPTDFIAGINPQRTDENSKKKHLVLLSNFFAQTEALLIGKNAEEVQTQMKNASELEKIKLIPHMIFAGNKPSTSILYEKLTPQILGALISFYEHKTFIQSVIWDINAFDQFGVELGKQLSVKINNELKENTFSEHDQSTKGLLSFFKKNQIL